jgi:hypothetical protein
MTVSEVPGRKIQARYAGSVCVLRCLWSSAVFTPRDFALALAGFLLLTVWKMPLWIVVVLLAGAGTLSELV